MKIYPIFFENSLSNYSYLLIGDKTICIDPFDGASIYNRFPDINIDLIVNTHQHFDHIQGNEYLLDRGAVVFEGSQIDMGGGNSLEIIETPGHTMDHKGVVHYMNEERVSFFAGDTLFSAGVGNCKNGGDPATLYQTVTKLLNALSSDTILYPGHDYRETNLNFARSLGIQTEFSKEGFTTLEDEREINPFLRVHDSEFLKLLKSLGVIGEVDAQEAFLTLRELRNNW